MSKSNRQKLNSLYKMSEKSGHRIYEVSTSWWALCFFVFGVCGCVLWNTLIPFNALRFDPYPYNGLRTVLALLGAIQAPILLIYSRKSTEYRRQLLESDFELEKKIYEKIERLEKAIKRNDDDPGPLRKKYSRPGKNTR